MAGPKNCLTIGEEPVAWILHFIYYSYYFLPPNYYSTNWATSKTPATSTHSNSHSLSSSTHSTPLTPSHHAYSQYQGQAN